MKKVLFILLLISSQGFSAGTTYYWVVGGTGTWSNDLFNDNWSLSSGGTIEIGVSPTIDDDVIFDENSGSDPVIINNALCRNLDANSFTGSFVASGGMTISGTSIVFGAGCSWGTPSGGAEMNITTANGAATLTTNGLVIGMTIYIDRDGDGSNSLTLNDDLELGDDCALKIAFADFFASNLNVTVGGIKIESKTENVDLGTGTITLFENDAVNGFGTYYVEDASNAAVTSASALFKLTSTAGTDVTFDPDAANTGGNYSFFRIRLEGGNTTEYHLLSGGTGNFYADRLSIITPPVSVEFDDGCTYYIDSMVVNGTAGNLNTINSTGSTYYLSPLAAQCWNYVSLTNCDILTASYAGCNSTNGGGNTNWTFNNCGVACPATGIKRNYAIIIQ